MQADSGTTMGEEAATCPRLPATIRRVVGVIPLAPVFPPIRGVLQRVFAAALEDGALEPLADREIAIVVEDLGLRIGFTQSGGRMEVTNGTAADAEIRGPVAAFLWLAAKRADADTLFFNRHLVMEGDTELGLVIKNLLDATELDALPTPLRQALDWFADRVPGQPPGAASMPG